MELLNFVCDGDPLRITELKKQPCKEVFMFIWTREKDMRDRIKTAQGVNASTAQRIVKK